MITRYIGEPRNISVEFTGDPLVPYGYDYSQINEVSMNLKRLSSSDEDDDYLEKLQSNGEVSVDQTAHRFTMNITSGDYSNLSVGQYELILAVQVPGETQYIELEVATPEVCIVQDKNRK